MIDGSPNLLRKAIVVSAVCHLIVVGIGVFGLSWHRTLAEDPPITVEIVAVNQALPEQPPTPEAAATAPLPKLEAASPRPGAETKPAAKVEAKPPEPAPDRPELEAKPSPPPPRPAEPEPSPPPAAPPEPRPVEPQSKPEPAPPSPAPPVKPSERAAPAEQTKIVEKAPPSRNEPKPKVAEPAKRPTPKEPVKQEPAVTKAKEPPEEKQEDDSFASLLKSVEQIEKRVQKDETRQGRGTAETAAPSMAEINALLASAQRQMESCWKLIGGVSGAEAFGTFDVNVHFRPTGEAESVQLVETPQLSNDPLFRSVAESAVRAAWSCKLSLPSEQYGIWRNIVFEFDPRRALTG